MKHIGIVACSSEGAALCFREICSEGFKLQGEHTYPEITLHSFPMSKYMAYVQLLDWEGVADVLIESARKVASAGAEFLICPANTAHAAFPFLKNRLPIPWLHIGEVVAEMADSIGYRKLGILGTKILMDSSIYPDVLKRFSIDSITPGEVTKERINELIYNELVSGSFTDETRAYFVEIISELQTMGCDAVVLGCTEIPLVVCQQDVDIPLLDSTRLLAAAALKRAVGGV